MSSPRMSSTPLFQTVEVCRSFHAGKPNETKAVDRLSLEIASGALCIVSGPSGSGKSTLLSLLGLLDRATGGQVLFQGRDLTKCSDVELARARRKIGFVFQDAALLPRMSLVDNIGYPLIPRGVLRRRRRELALHWLARLGIARHAAKRPAELSAGERQRVALARALAGEPIALLADEPTSNLDPATRSDVCGLFRELHSAGVTVVAATHDESLAALATQVVRLHNGALAEDRPASPVGDGRAREE